MVKPEKPEVLVKNAIKQANKTNEPVLITIDRIELSVKPDDDVNLICGSLKCRSRNKIRDFNSKNKIRLYSFMDQSYE